MKDQKLADQLAQTGLEHLQTGRLQEAESCYLEALQLIEQKNWNLVDYHDEFAEVLNSLGKNREAREQLEQSLKLAIEISDRITDYEVTHARHMLAEHLNTQGYYQAALDLVKPFLGKGCDSDWMLYLSAAESLKALGDMAGAQLSAHAVLTKVPADSRERVEQQLAKYLN